jgi:hypothetical protein
MMHVGLPLLLTAVALAVSSTITDPTATMVVLTVAAIGVFCTFAVFWTLPTAWLSGTAAAGAIALINSIGNLARVRRALSDRLGQASDRLDLDGPVDAGDIATDRRLAGFRRREREQGGICGGGAGEVAIHTSPRRRPGPIRHGPSFGTRGDALLKQLFAVVMGPDLRRGDGGYYAGWSGQADHELTFTKS